MEVYEAINPDQTGHKEQYSQGLHCLYNIPSGEKWIRPNSEIQKLISEISG